MKTKEEVISILESDLLASTAVRTADVNGANENFGVCEISALLDEDAEWLTIHNYEYDGCAQATPDNVDIDVWAQEFDSDNVAALRETMESGNLYIAKFSSDEYGIMEILIWD